MQINKAGEGDNKKANSKRVPAELSPGFALGLVQHSYIGLHTGIQVGGWFVYLYTPK
jgi:hypothetical protein